MPTGPGDIPSNPVMLNQGGGIFGAPTVSLGLSPTNDVLIGDDYAIHIASGIATNGKPLTIP